MSAGKTLYKPLSLVSSVIGALLAGKIFTEIWQRVSQEPAKEVIMAHMTSIVAVGAR